jgi:hypothetical protein
MPMAIPLLAAAGSVYAGVAAGGIIGGMMIAGGAMTAVGTLSGNKKLAKWGGLLSLAGGVAGMATGAWSAAADGIAAESMSGGYTNQMDLASDAFAGGASDGMLGSVAADAASGVISAPVSPGGEFASTELASAAPPGVQTAPAAPTTPAGVAPPTPAPVTAPQAPGVALKPTPPPVDTTGGVLQPAMDWAKANPRLTQAGTGLLSAGLNYYGAQDAAKESMRLNEEAQQRARDRMNASVTGVRVPTYKRKG